MRFNVIELPGRVKLPARSFCSVNFHSSWYGFPQ
jgi:hypothetical protein